MITGPNFQILGHELIVFGYKTRLYNPPIPASLIDGVDTETLNLCFKCHDRYELKDLNAWRCAIAQKAHPLLLAYNLDYSDPDLALRVIQILPYQALQAILVDLELKRRCGSEDSCYGVIRDKILEQFKDPDYEEWLCKKPFISGLFEDLFHTVYGWVKGYGHH